MLKGILIGNLEALEAEYRMIELARRDILISAVYSENGVTSDIIQGDICSVKELTNIRGTSDFVFLNGMLQENYRRIVKLAGYQDDQIFEPCDNEQLVGADAIIEYYRQETQAYRNAFQGIEQSLITYGDFSYGIPKIHSQYTGLAKVRIGKFCAFGDHVTLMLDSEHDVRSLSSYPFSEKMYEFFSEERGYMTRGDIVIENDVWIGSGARIMSGVRIGNGAIVGAGSVVTKDVCPYSIVAGNPAKLIRKRFDDEYIELLQKMKWWDWGNEKLFKAIPLLQEDDIVALQRLHESEIE